MRRSALAVLALVALTLAGCSNEQSLDSPEGSPVEAAAASSPPTYSGPLTGSATPPTSTPLTSLPPAPPLETWMVKGNDFQQTLDLNMQTAMISNLGIAPSDTNEVEARALAYYICSALRDGTSSPGSGSSVQAAYPTVETFETFRVELAAQRYCLDTVSVS